MKRMPALSSFKIDLAAALFFIMAVGTAYGQGFPEGLVGLSSHEPAVLYSIDSSTGAATPIVTLNGGASLTGLTYLNGILYGSDLFGFPGTMSDYDIGSISRNGIISFLSDQNGSSDWQALASNCGGGIIYAVDNDNNYILTAQRPNGSVTTIGSGTGITSGVSGLEYDDTDNILYALGQDGSLYTVSTANGTSSLIGSTGVPSGRAGLAYDESNRILYLNSGETHELYTLDVNTGAATLIGSNNVDDEIDGLAWKENCSGFVERPIPTLSEWGLIALAGILGFAGYMTIRKRAAAA